MGFGTFLAWRRKFWSLRKKSLSGTFACYLCGMAPQTAHHRYHAGPSMSLVRSPLPQLFRVFWLLALAVLKRLHLSYEKRTLLLSLCGASGTCFPSGLARLAWLQRQPRGREELRNLAGPRPQATSGKAASLSLLLFLWASNGSLIIM